MLPIQLVRSGALALSIVLAAHSTCSAQFDAEKYQQLVSRAINYLRTTGQASDGSYSKAAGPAITALVTTGVLRSGRTADDPLVARSLEYLEGFVSADGSISRPDSLHKNYETCIALLCFVEANTDGRYDEIISRAEAFVKGLQWDEGEGAELADFEYGGGGYGRHKRPDLSNTSFLIDALVGAGNDADDPSIQAALVFVSRCQNLESEHNTSPFAAKVDDGGFYYTVAAGGQSQAGQLDGGGLRSYGSMTYAGLKSMIYAGLTADDPRVAAAVGWIEEHYTLAENPEMGQAGLFYYYHTFAKALDALGVELLIDQHGIEHDWRADLVDELARRQRPDGTWINETERWMEGDPNLVTGYALLALAYCRSE